MFLWECVANGIWGIAKLFLQSAYNPSPALAQANANHAAAWAGTLELWDHDTTCHGVNWQLTTAVTWPTSHSCALPASREKECSRETHTLLTQRCWNSSCLGCKQTLSVSWGGRQCINKETDHRQQTNREEKSRNTIHGPGFSDTTIGKLTAYKHVQLLSSEEHVVQEKEFCIKQNWFKS